jgi:hypothetical protein
MPDDHCPVMPQITAVDEQFGTHTRPRVPPLTCMQALAALANNALALTHTTGSTRRD